MTLPRTRTTAGTLLILGAVLVNIPYVMLIMTFDYPDILRAPAAEILGRFSTGGPGLIWTWLAFAWAGLPILLGILLLPRALAVDAPEDRGRQSGKLALVFGAAGAVAQMIGLLRWVFVVPGLARVFADPQASSATRDAAVVAFQVVHSFGGVLLGEHIGQIFTIIWMAALSVSLLRTSGLPRWLPISGFIASAIYLDAQGELIATVIPGLPTWEAAGLVGSLLWLGWTIALGVLLLRGGRVARSERAIAFSTGR